MTRRRRMLLGFGLGVMGLLGFALMAYGQADPLAGTIQQYEQDTKKKVDRAKADDLYECAKWCYKGGLGSDAMKAALEANQKAPDDPRPKMLLYLLTNEDVPPDLSGGAGGLKPVAVTITDEEANGLFKTEGEDRLNGFRTIQNMLVMRCGDLKCHGGQSDKHWGIARQALTSRKTLAQNFRSISTYLNREKAEESRLLQVPLKAQDSGHPPGVIRSSDESIFTKTRDWIKTLKTAGEMLWDRAGKPGSGGSPFK